LRIRENAFKGLQNLTNITIGKQQDSDPDPPLREIGSSAFAGTGIGPVLRFGEAFCYLGSFAFSKCKNLKAFILPTRSTLTEIHIGTFEQTPIQKVIAPGVEYVVHGAFEGCQGLKEAIFYEEDALKPNHLTKLWDKCFGDPEVCLGLSDATIEKMMMERKLRAQEG
jgi:hypothetical protein